MDKYDVARLFEAHEDGCAERSACALSGCECLKPVDRTGSTQVKAVTRGSSEAGDRFGVHSGIPSKRLRNVCFAHQQTFASLL